MGGGATAWVVLIQATLFEHQYCEQILGYLAGSAGLLYKSKYVKLRLITESNPPILIQRRERRVWNILEMRLTIGCQKRTKTKKTEVSEAVRSFWMGESGGEMDLREPIVERIAVGSFCHLPKVLSGEIDPECFDDLVVGQIGAEVLDQQLAGSLHCASRPRCSCMWDPRG